MDLDNIDLSSLVPVMYAHYLITNDERDMLLDSKSSKKAKIGHLLQMVDTKGPLAYSILAQCLNEEDSQPIHAELYRKSTSRKRSENPDSHDMEVLAVPKRVPQRLQMEKPFCGKMYSHFIGNIQKCYQSSSWTDLERVAREFISQNVGDHQLTALAMIEEGYSLSCQKGKKEKAIECLSDAESVIEGTIKEKKSNNYFFLLARCKHIRATIHRYSGEDEESLKKNNEAFDLLFHCVPGDDATRVSYGIACARLEKLGQFGNSLQEFKEIKDRFQCCLEYGRRGTPGLCPSRARCLIRLAQLTLTTTTDGQCLFPTTPTDIKEAESYLKKVRVTSISRRCQALFYLIKSDIYKCKSNTDKDIELAKKLAMQALEIAKDAKLGVEQSFAKSRLERLQTAA